MPRRGSDQPAIADAGRAVASIRAEVTRLRAGLARIEDELGVLEAAEPPPLGLASDRPERYLQVLVDVYELGGRHGVDSDGLASIGRGHGYDRRGLGGFFTGTRAPLRRVERRVKLTPYGEHLVDLYLRRLRQ